MKISILLSLLFLPMTLCCAAADDDGPTEQELAELSVEISDLLHAEAAADKQGPRRKSSNRRSEIHRDAERHNALEQKAVQKELQKLRAAEKAARAKGQEEASRRIRHEMQELEAMMRMHAREGHDAKRHDHGDHDHGDHDHGDHDHGDHDRGDHDHGDRDHGDHDHGDHDHGDHDHGDHDHGDHDHGDHDHGDHDHGDHDHDHGDHAHDHGDHDHHHPRDHKRMEIQRHLEHMHMAMEHLAEIGMHDLVQEIKKRTQPLMNEQREIQLAEQAEHIQHLHHAMEQMTRQMHELHREVERMRKAAGN